MRLRERKIVVGLAAASFALTACAASEDDGDAPPMTLQMAHIDGGLLLDPAVEWFTERVAEVSAGELQVEVVNSCCGRDPEVEQQLVEAVAAGEFDLGWVGTRVFADLGVTSLQALTAPMLLDSYALQEAVIGSDILDEMLDGLDAMGVTGIAVLPGPLRRPASAERPLVAPQDWQGITFHVFRSSGNEAAVAALGATPTDVGFDARDQGLFDGDIQGFENSIIFHADGRQSLTPYVTVNVNLWPRISALLANPDVLSGLSDTQAGWLRQAASDVAQRTGELAEVDAAVIADSCRAGARYAAATDAELTTLTQAFAPAYAELEQDPATKTLVERIRELKQDITPEEPLDVPDGCTDDAPLDAAGDDDLSALAGVYRSVEWTAESLQELGLGEQDAENIAGVFTFTFDDGRFELRHESAGGDVFGCVGTYTVAGGHVTVGYEPGGDCGGGGELFNAAFELSGGSLRFTDLIAGHSADTIVFGSQPWKKVD